MCNFFPYPSTILKHKPFTYIIFPRITAQYMHFIKRLFKSFLPVWFNKAIFFCFDAILDRVKIFSIYVQCEYSHRLANDQASGARGGGRNQPDDSNDFLCPPSPRHLQAVVRLLLKLIRQAEMCLHGQSQPLSYLTP